MDKPPEEAAAMPPSEPSNRTAGAGTDDAAKNGGSTPYKPATSKPPVVRRRTLARSSLIAAGDIIDKGVGEVQEALPGGVNYPVAGAQQAGFDAKSAVGAAGDSPGTRGPFWFSDWFVKRFSKREGGDQEDSAQEAKKVSFLALLSFSTTKEKWLMALGLVMAAVSGCAVPTWLLLLASALDRFSNLGYLINAGQDLMDLVEQELNKLVVGFAILGGVALVSGISYVAIWTYTGEKQALRIKDKYVRSAFHQDAEWFDKNNRDELPTKVANSMIHINAAIGRQIADLFCNMWSSAGCLAVAFVLNAPLALIMLCIVPVVAVVIAVVACFIRKSSREAHDSFSAAGGLATEVISGIKTVAALCMEPWALTTYTAHVIDARRASVYGGFLSALSTAIVGFLFYCTYTFAFFVGTEQVANNSSMVQIVYCFIAPWLSEWEPPRWWYWLGLPDPGSLYDEERCKISGATVMCCIYGVILCATFFGLMAPALQAINLGRQAAADIFDTIKHVPGIDPSDGEGDIPDELEGTVELSDLFFTYPTRPRTLLFKGVQLTAEKGTSVAIVGPSGSGKSTIARLLLRFYDPIAGAVKIDGIPLQDLNLEWWRSQVGYVAQEPVMFPGTIRENIACGKSNGKEGSPEVTENEVIEAAKAACCHDFIKELPDGYDTFYSGASIQLSGGQMQRICIARAMIRNPTVLLLDEATSALDTNSERQVQMAVDNIREHKSITTLTIAHRLSTIVNSDQIAVIAEGAVVELGTHKELIALDGIYTGLCESQGITAESTFEDNESPPPLPPGGSIKYSVHQSLKASVFTEEGGTEDVENKGEDADAVAAAEAEQEEVKLASKSRLWDMNRPEWGYIAMGTIGSCMVGALPPCEGILTANIVANFYEQSPENMRDANYVYIMSFLALGAGCLIGNILAGCGFSVSGYRLTQRMRGEVFEAMIRRDMGWFDFPEHSTGELTTRLEADAEAVAKVTGWVLGYRVRICATLIAGVAIALAYAWQVGLVAFACIPLIMGAAIVQKCCLSKRFIVDQGPDYISPPTLLEQGLRGINSVQAYGLEEKMCNNYTKALQPEAEGKIRMGAVAGFVFGFSQASVYCSFAVLFYVGSQLLIQMKIDFREFFTAILAVMFGALGIAQVTVDFNAQEEGLAAAQRIFDIVDEPYNDLDPLSKEGDEPDSVEGAISFESVNFAYPTRPNHPVYYPSKDGTRDGFSLSISPQDSVAFVGQSGCGKSTALQLFLKFYVSSSGTVNLDGHDVTKLNTRWLRRQIGYVGQMPVLFAGTVRENILRGNERATEDEIVAAAKAANAHDFIMGLSDGYDTDIGVGGMLLSGGQRQRIAISRAIVSNPKILVLDEATSALDNESEKIVQAALDDLQEKQPRTTLVVAHRLGTVKNCTKIAVLDRGGVRELGSHDELLELKGLYHELWMKQGGAEES
eukprot:CAMPEP_0197456878 /NCGR_PEP_ID=MMETSP1175-20131217/44537_1 /TAXON_ID=1003142 /ORGANISM="Triceratium dubium, Strain CCMP147" /LENGTH=1434 /DNA_ID=CAMNT_0042991077 /DNA_START=181 /DNA_END=4485 /DNA_ORIENTATION=-